MDDGEEKKEGVAGAKKKKKKKKAKKSMDLDLDMDDDDPTKQTRFSAHLKASDLAGVEGSLSLEESKRHSVGRLTPKGRKSIKKKGLATIGESEGEYGEESSDSK